MWLESHANLARHPKTRRLMKRLGWSLPDTIGNLHLFWYWALDFAPTGDLTPYTPEELTADLDLLGATPDQFIAAMIYSGFIDRCGSGPAESRLGGTMIQSGFLDCSESSSPESQESETLRIHDWVDYKRPRPRRKPAGSSRSAEAGAAHPTRPARLPALSPRPVHTGPHPELAVPPRREEPTPTFTRQTSSSDAGEAEPQQVPATHARINTQSIAGGGAVTPTTPESSSNNAETPTRDDLRLDIPANTDPSALPSEQSRPAVAGHDPQLVAPPRRGWWPLYIDFHNKAGTPLSADARAKFLARLEKDPLTAIAQIKRIIAQAVRSGTQWSGILEHAP